MPVEIPLLLTKHELEVLDKLVLQYIEESKKASGQAIQRSGKLLSDLTNSFLENEPLAEWTRLNITASYLSDLRTILLNFCIEPLLKISNDEISKVFEMVSSVISSISEELDEFESASSIFTWVHNKYYKHYDAKVKPLLLEYRFFEAGFALGQLVGMSANSSGDFYVAERCSKSGYGINSRYVVNKQSKGSSLTYCFFSVTVERKAVASYFF